MLPISRVSCAVDLFQNCVDLLLCKTEKFDVICCKELKGTKRGEGTQIRKNK